VEVSGRAKAVLLLHAAGETIQLEPIRAAKESEYHHRIQGRLAGGNDYLAIFVLIVAREQATSENNALLDVSTADLSLGVHAAV
jgi:hypothetical protein